MTLLRFLRGYLHRYVPWLIVAALTVPLYGLSSVAMIAMIEPIFGEVLLATDDDRAAMPIPIPGEEGAESPEGGGFSFNLKRQVDGAYQALKRAFDIGPDEVLYFTPLLFVLIFFFRGLANFVSGYSLQRVGLGITTDIRNDLYEAMLHQSSLFHRRHNSGELVSRLVADVSVMQSAITTRLIDLLLQSLTLVFLLYLLLSTDLSLALVCLVATPLILYPIYRFGRDMRRTSHRMQERLAHVVDRLSEGVRGYRVIQAFRGESYEHRRFAKTTREHLRASLWAQLLTNLSSPVVEALASIALAVFLIYAGMQIRAGELSAPRLIMFLANLMALYDPIRKLNRVNLALQQAIAACDRVRRVLDAPNAVEDRPGAVALAEIREGIRFEHVGFAYDTEPVLRGVDLTIPRGSIVALVGPSGAGKSSLVNLLPRFYDPTEGRVTIDGVDVRDVTLASLRDSIGIVSQETTLFDDTVRANIAYARPDASPDDVEAAARAAFADEFVRRMPNGYDTGIGEAGLQLSGGQRQRLAIARALFKNAPILILDEATSHLDSESEALVQQALDNLMKDRTTLVIAHRLATVMQADRIVVMEDGRITEQGTHEDLLEQDGTYRRLFDLQFRRRDSA